MLGERNRHCDRGDNSVLSRGRGEGGIRKRVGPMEMEHTVTSAKTGGYDGDLSLTLLRGPEGAVIYFEVLWAVENGGMLLMESDGGHEDEERWTGRGGEEWRERDGVTWIFKRKRQDSSFDGYKK